MTTLITGGAGLIGSHITERLIGKGERVVIIDNLKTGRIENLPSSDLITFVEGSLADKELVMKTFADHKPEVVIHCACDYKDLDDYEAHIAGNVLGAAHLITACKKYDIKRLVYFQTALCYGLNPGEEPLPTTQQLNPEGSSYAYSKTSAEQYFFLSGIPTVVFKLANIYGPRNLSGPIPIFFQRLSSGKACFVTDSRRDFVFVDDLVDVVEKAAAMQGKNGVYHISSGSDYAIKEIYEAVGKAIGLDSIPPVEVKERDPSNAFRLLLDNNKTKNDFSWDVKTSLQDGVNQAVAWYKKHGVAHTVTQMKKAKD